MAKARHHYTSPDFRALLLFMSKDLGYSDKKIAATLGLRLMYFLQIVGMIPELGQILYEARKELMTDPKHGLNVCVSRKIISITPDTNFDVPDINTDIL